jgi:predicted nucleotidyltransferase
MDQGVVQRLRRALADRREVHLALLFGSVARGTDRPGSDVDVAVDAPGVDLLALARDLSLALDREVSVVELTDPGYPLLAALVRDGVVLVEHAAGAAARWRTRAILSLETDRSWYERMRDAYLARLARGAHPGG